MSNKTEKKQSTNNKTEKKSSGWFTKKEVTTPLLILNRLLDLKDDKRLRLKVEKPLGKSKKKRATRDTEVDKQKRIEESDKRMRDKEERKQQDSQEKKEETVTVEANIPIDFQGIDSKNQEYLKHIIPQLNAIYKAVTQKDIDEQTGQNEVKITREGFDDENTIVEASTTVYVPKYIPPIKNE